MYVSYDNSLTNANATKNVFNDNSLTNANPTKNVINASTSDKFNFNIELSDLSNAFKFNANSNVINNDDLMDTGFKPVNSKRKMKKSSENSNSNDDRPGLKIAKHAATSRSFELPTQILKLKRNYAFR